MRCAFHFILFTLFFFPLTQSKGKISSPTFLLLFFYFRYLTTPKSSSNTNFSSSHFPKTPSHFSIFLEILLGGLFPVDGDWNVGLSASTSFVMAIYGI